MRSAETAGCNRAESLNFRQAIKLMAGSRSTDVARTFHSCTTQLCCCSPANRGALCQVRVYPAAADP